MGVQLTEQLKTLLDSINAKRTYKISQANYRMPYDTGYATSSDVYAITSKIARSIQEIPYLLNYKVGENVDIITSGDVYDRVNKPNENQSLEEFKAEVGLNLLLSGEFFLKNEDTAILSDSIDPMNPQLTRLITKFSDSKNELIRYEFTGGSKTVNINKDFVTHIKLHNPTITGYNSMRGLSPLIAGYLSLKGIINNQTANASILDNQAVAGLLTNENGDILTDTERSFGQRAIDKLFGGSKKFGQVVQGLTSSKYIPLGLTPTQLKLIESKLITFRDLCAIYDVKPMLFSDTQGANFNNLKFAEKSFQLNAVLPNDKLIMKGLQRSLLDPINEFERGDYYLTQDTSKILPLQEDMSKEAQKDKVKMEGINLILGMPIPTEGKVELLISEYNYDEEKARLIVGTGSEE